MDIWYHANGIMAHADYTYDVDRTTRNTQYPCLMGISRRITQSPKNRHADIVMRANHWNGLQQQVGILADEVETPHASGPIYIQIVVEKKGPWVGWVVRWMDGLTHGWTYKQTNWPTSWHWSGTLGDNIGFRINDIALTSRLLEIK